MTFAGGVPFPPLPFPNFDIGQFPQPVTPPPSPALLVRPERGPSCPPDAVELGLQREITRDLVVEATYVGNLGVWWNAPHYANPNAMTPDILARPG